MVVVALVPRDCRRFMASSSSSSSSSSWTPSTLPQSQNNNDGSSIVRLVIISDTHNHHKELTPLLPPPCERNRRTILLHCGDFADRGSLRCVRSFCRWLSHDEGTEDTPPPPSPTTTLSGLPSHFDEVVVVDGNHDHSRPPLPPIDLASEFEECNRRLQQQGSRRRVHFLQDASVTIAGIRIHGVSWRSIQYQNYAGDYSAIVVHDDGQDGKGIMMTPDIVVSHLVPYFSKQEQKQAIIVKSDNGSKNNSNNSGIDFRAWQGSKQLKTISRHYKIPLVLSGHVHWGRGAVYIPSHGGGDDDGSGTTHDHGTLFVNAASTKPHRPSMNHSHAGSNVTAPVIIEYDTKHRRVVRISCPAH